MARFFTDFSGLPIGDITTSGQTDWTFRINGGTTLFDNYRHYGGSNMLRLKADATNASRVISYNPLNGITDNLETLTMFNVIPTSGDGSIGRFGVNYIRYSGTTEATTKGYAASFLPVSSVKNVVLQEDSTGVVQNTPFAWTTNTWYMMRTRISGNDRYVKVWPLTSAEPGTWTLQSSATPPAMTDIFSGLGTYTAGHTVFVAQFSAGTNGDTAPMYADELVPTSTPQIGGGGGYGGIAGYGTPYGEVNRQTALNVTLTVANASHGHTADNITVTSVHTLAIANTSHAHTATSPAITSVHTLSIANASHAHTTLGPLTLTKNIILAVANALHGHTADNIVLISGTALTVANASHGLSSDNIALSQNQTIVIADALHGHSVDSIVITEAKTLVINSTNHSLVDTGPLSLSVTHILGIANAAHSLVTTGALALGQQATLAIQNALHGLTSDTIAIIQFTLLNKPDDAVHGITSDNVQLTSNQFLEIDNATHKHIAETIAKIINWTEMNVDFGYYIPGGGKSGGLESVDPTTGGIYIPRDSSDGTYLPDTIDEGIIIPVNIKTGKF